MKWKVLPISIILFFAVCDKNIPVDTVTTYIKQLNNSVTLHFDEIDKKEASRGLIAEAKHLILKDSQNNVIWNMGEYSFLQNTNSETAHPLLWQFAKINSVAGVYEVTKGIYQIRGFDLANMTIVEGNSGWIIIDTLSTIETAKAAFNFFVHHIGKQKPVVAVIFTHSHIDHFGGVLGLIDENNIKTKNIKVIAPKGFMEEALSENVMLAMAMSRRAEYQFGENLQASSIGRIDSGIGKGMPHGTYSIIAPTRYIDTTPTKLLIDGIQFIFQYTPDTEAPAEMTIYIPKYKAFCPAEIANRTMHNLYTLRGAKVRDAYKWSSYINEARELFKDADICFFTHLWPMWGNARIMQFLEKQADMYKYIHDQTIRLANKGFTPDEIAEILQLPDSLSNVVYNRNFYGTLQQNVKAVYQFYLGWYNGNPAYLNPLPQVERAKRYVAYMGGDRVIVQKAQESYNDGDYRWVVEVLNHVVMAEPDNKEAKVLLAKAYTQLAYHSESAVWRNEYLSAAQELSNGMSKKRSAVYRGYNVLKYLPVQKLFDSLAVNVNPKKANNVSMRVKFEFTDIHQSFLVTIRNSVLYCTHYNGQEHSASIALPYVDFIKLILGMESKLNFLLNKKIQMGGDRLKLIQFFSLFEKMERFNIVLPNTN
ncbi:MAG: alkyl/aryl-sulfatase [Spirochaetota bacterium]